MKEKNKWSEPQKYRIDRRMDEPKADFDRRVANEIKTIKGKITDATFRANFAELWVSELIQNRLVY